MSTTKRISVVVATRNRAYYLQKALRSFCIQNIAKEQYEIIVVDNGSTDNTKEIVFSIATETGFDLHYYFESKFGSSNAINRGIFEAQGDIIVTADDDIIACREWLGHILQEFDTSPQIGIVGGKIKPIWSQQPEEWIYDYGTDKWHGLFAYLDYGDSRKVLQDEYLFGCNFAIRKELILKVGGWHPNVYPEHLIHLSGDGEYGVIDSVRKLNYAIVYRPDALVEHHADPSRCTLDYFIYRHKRWAVEWVYTQFRNKAKEVATKELSELALSYTHQAYRECSSKQNPQYYFQVWSRVSAAMFEQIMRVLLDNSLYAHITQESYLQSFERECLKRK